MQYSVPILLVTVALAVMRECVFYVCTNVRVTVGSGLRGERKLTCIVIDNVSETPIPPPTHTLHPPRLVSQQSSSPEGEGGGLVLYASLERLASDLDFRLICAPCVADTRRDKSLCRV